MENLENLIAAFKGELSNKNENIIKKILVENETEHKIGIFNLLKNQIPEYQITSEIKNVLADLLDYFTGNEFNCHSKNIDLNKGIFLVGPVGTGKSIIMQGYKNYTRIFRKNSFQYFGINEICDKININGVKELDRFYIQDTGNKFQTITCLIDDLGSRNEIVNNYGTQINVTEQLLTYRYIVFQKYKKLTHFTSNIYPSELSKLYDTRVVERISEMCNVIELSGKNFRTKKNYL